MRKLQCKTQGWLDRALVCWIAAEMGFCAFQAGLLSGLEDWVWFAFYLALALVGLLTLLAWGRALWFPRRCVVARLAGCGDRREVFRGEVEMGGRTVTCGFFQETVKVRCVRCGKTELEVAKFFEGENEDISVRGVWS